RDVHRHPRAGESLGDAVVRDPSAELDAGLPDLAQPVLRVTNPVDGEAELRKGAGGIDQILADLPRSLVVPPVADPHHVVGLFRLAWIKDGGIGGLVEGPDASLAEIVSVDLG